MLFNVATLLGEPVGSVRAYRVERERARVPKEEYEATASGTVEMLRTARGVLVHALLALRPRLDCARCLRSFEHDLTLEFDEEFVTELDPETGEPVEGIAPEDFRIDDRQHLDLSEAVRQYEQSARPMHPLCRPRCAGLCPSCGQDLNQRACGCRRDELDSRWAGLAAFAERLRTEEDDGGAEAQDAEGEAAASPQPPPPQDSADRPRPSDRRLEGEPPRRHSGPR